MNPLILAQEIIDGRRITRKDDLSFFLTCDLDELCEGADRIREAYIGDKVDLCSIINGRSGRCPEDCKYCAQSVHHHTSCEIYDFLPEEKILEACKMNEEEGVDRFSIVTAGKALTGKEFDQAIHAYETMSGLVPRVSSIVFSSYSPLVALAITASIRFPTHHW